MGFSDYEKALKMGQKAYRSAISSGHYPYLPVLDDILKSEDIKGEVPIKGVVQIPIDRIVGTKTEGRTTAFASNFMPLLEFKTEFAQKWMNLCNAHIEEGIRDPIKVYEYMNHYYVEEGNKRVSVLKYFDADSIAANVIREVPQMSEDPRIKAYYEYMDFHRNTGISLIYFTKPGGFKKLLEIIGNTSEDYSMTDDEIMNIVSSYRMFERCFKEKGGASFAKITPGDAYLIFIDYEGYDKIKEMLPTEMNDEMVRLWKEYQLLGQDDSIEISLDPIEEKKKPLFGLFAPDSSNKTVNAAFLFDRDPLTSDWLYAHELGRLHVKNVFGDKLNAIKITNADSDEVAVEIMEDLIKNQGTEVIFTTTSKLVDASTKIAIKYPDVRVLNCSLNTSHRYLRTYYARLYEAKFLSGIIAGSMDNTGNIAYLADYPIFGVIANINAFALGAKLVNPDVKVHLRWTTLADGATRRDIYESLYDEGISYISDQDMMTPKNNEGEKFGLHRVGETTDTNLAMTVCNWGELYEKILHKIQNGSYVQDRSENNEKAINYWWGLSAGAIDIIMSDSIPVSTKRLVETIKALIVEGKFSPFGGEIVDQEGNVHCNDELGLTPEDIMKMDYLVENVVGEIPTLSLLKDKAKDIVELKGVKKEDEDTGIS